MGMYLCNYGQLWLTMTMIEPNLFFYDYMEHPMYLHTYKVVPHSLRSTFISPITTIYGTLW